MNSKTKKILLSIIAVAVLAFGIFYLTAPKKADALGTIDVEVVNLEGETTKEATIDFYPEDTLTKLVEENFDNVVVEDGMIVALEDFVTPEDWSQFLAILVDDEMSPVGINDIELIDGLKVSFVVTEFVNE